MPETDANCDLVDKDTILLMLLCTTPLKASKKTPAFQITLSL